MLKAGLQLSLGQSLTMTPQLQQAIRLLQLSSIELQAEIQEQLENNPMLELDESDDWPDDGTAVAAREDHADRHAGDRSDLDAAAAERNVRDAADADPSPSVRDDDGFEAVDDERLLGAASEASDAAETDSLTHDIPEELPLDGRWEDIYDQPHTSSRHGDSDDRDPFERIAATSGDLIDHLIWQIHLSPLGALERDIALFIVESVRPDGYLETPIVELHAAFLEQTAADGSTQPPQGAEHVPLDAFVAVQRWVQQLDPVGCACETPRDSLLAQLCALSREWRAATQMPTPDTGHRSAWTRAAAGDDDTSECEALQSQTLDLARSIVRDHFETLTRRDYRGLARALGASPAMIQRAIDVIRTLDPRPGARFSTTPTEYIAPDVYVVHVPGVGWQARINPDIAPNLRVNERYARYAREARNARDAAFLKGHLQEARWFLKSLQARNDTILRVAQAIVDRQTGFFEHGEIGMRPMVLRDIAEALSLHESTISRVTQGKYLHTPRGLYEFKYFFSSHVSTEGGGECSATAIRAMLRELIENESPARPLSDARLAAILQERGIQVARRTVAKYREGMQIPSSSERRVTV